MQKHMAWPVPFGRLGHPVEAAAVSLVSAGSEYVIDQAIEADSGNVLS